MRIPFSSFLCAVVLAAQISAEAATVTYTFESPVFTAGQTTPLLNKTPNVGSSSFLASFTSTPTGNGFVIGNNPNFPGSLCLFDNGIGTPDTLTISFNTPVTSVQMDFALFFPGHLDFSSTAGNISALTGPSSQTGFLSFSSPSAFTQFTLSGFSAANSPVVIGIDNLSMTIVPEPGMGALLLAGVFCRLCYRVSRRS